MISWESWVPAVLLIGCLASFVWAMSRFFTQPVGSSAGKRLISICGGMFGIQHLSVILFSSNLTIERSLAGSVLYIGSAGLFWWAIQTSLSSPLSAAFSSDLPTHLVVHGPYLVIRHPLYCSYLICWLAGWVVTANLWLVPSVATMLIIYLLAAAREEQKFMRSPLSGAYRQYRFRTGLFVPMPLKLLSSWRNSHQKTFVKFGNHT
jgi:protein-S-isoprenylcysteine O-methyltransferase Ste14